MNWTLIDPCSCNTVDCPECGAYEPRQCHTPKCQLCGRFTKSLTLVWTRGAEPEPDYEVGDCCKDRR